MIYLRASFFTPRLLLSTVPPAVPVIYSEQNEPIESRAGPYEESGQLILTCVVMGGKKINFLTSWNFQLKIYNVIGKELHRTLKSSTKNPVQFDLYHQK